MTEPIKVNPPDYANIPGGSPPRPIPPGPIHSGGATPVDLTAAAFGAASNADLTAINTQIAEDHADRAGHAIDAARKFTAHEGDAAAQFQDVAAQGDAALAGQAPQDAMGGAMQGADGAMQGVTSALSGVLGSVGRLPQGLLQAGQGALSPLMSAAQSMGSGGLDDTELASDLDPDPGWGGNGVGPGAGGGPGIGTTPASNLGPPPLPGASPPTTPAGAMISNGMVGRSGGAPAAGAAGGPLMPMMPAGTATDGRGGKDDKDGGKRIAAPGVPNGQPVKGRTTAPPNVPVTKSVRKDAGQPVITPLKRIAGKGDPLK